MKSMERLRSVRGHLFLSRQGLSRDLAKQAMVENSRYDRIPIKKPTLAKRFLNQVPTLGVTVAIKIECKGWTEAPMC